MDVNRDHLYRDLASVPERFRKDVVPVPEHLQAAAEVVLDGQDEASVKEKALDVRVRFREEALRLLEFSQKERKNERRSGKLAKRPRRKHGGQSDETERHF